MTIELWDHTGNQVGTAELDEDHAVGREGYPTIILAVNAENLPCFYVRDTPTSRIFHQARVRIVHSIDVFDAD